MMHNILFATTIFIVFLFAVLHEGHGAKILFLGFAVLKSHKLAYDPLLNKLAERGHEVHILTQIPSTRNKTNPKEILTHDFLDLVRNTMDAVHQGVNNGGTLRPQVGILEKLCHETYALPQVRDLLNQKYDLVIHEPVWNQCAAGLLYKLNTSFILVTPIYAPTDLVWLLGGPSPLSIIPNNDSPFDNEMNFLERLWNFLMEIDLAIFREITFVPSMENVYRKALNDSSIPSSAEIYRNASLLLTNSHISLSGPRPFMPNVIQVGGMHLHAGNPLLQDLEDFIQSSGEQGFIFFSMGSMIQSSSLPENKINVILSAFSQVKQKVLWKFETDAVLDLPPNVKLVKWAPQQDILAHAKLRVFISHGGLFSATEAIYHGVPFIGIPMVFDQPATVKKCMRMGIALQLDFNALTEENIVGAVEEIISDPKYLRKAKELSRQFKDQQENPLDRAVHWVEYVLRHNGAVHLRSPALNFNFVQYHSLDIILVLLTLLLGTLFLLWRIFKQLSIMCIIFLNSFSTNTKKKN